ncbi:hypothetical protein [Microbacterium sp. LWH13-1.2]|uniref:hypothetical protein n=1 Tax=Microbacterium sp. LWH13-1.2 TaxID=3135260 RepID=UPI003139FA08
MSENPAAPEVASTWAAITLMSAAFAGGVVTIALAVERSPVAAAVFGALSILAVWGAIVLRPFAG